MSQGNKWFFILFIFIIFILLGGGYWYLWRSIPKTEITNNIHPSLSCQTDNDCLAKDKKLGIKYHCQNSKCIKEFLNNPAEIECQKNKGEVVKKRNFKGREYEVCVFPDGSECEVWSFFQKKCAIGQFNPDDNIWEGYLFTFRGEKYDDYFTFLNGESIGITGKDKKINNQLVFWRDSGKLLRLKGDILPNDFEPAKKVLVVEKILNINLFFPSFSDFFQQNTSTEVLDREVVSSSPQFSSSTVRLGDSSVATPKISSTTIQYQNLSSAPLDMDILYGCEEFALAKKCSTVQEPVCAKVVENKIVVGDVSPTKVIWQDFSSPCQACLYKTRTSRTVGYKMGKCSD